MFPLQKTAFFKKRKNFQILVPLYPKKLKKYFIKNFIIFYIQITKIIN